MRTISNQLFNAYPTIEESGEYIYQYLERQGYEWFCIREEAGRVPRGKILISYESDGKIAVHTPLCNGKKHEVNYYKKWSSKQ